MKATTRRGRASTGSSRTRGRAKYFDTEWSLNGAPAKTIAGYYTTTVTDLALDWLRQRDAAKPWALCIGQKAPHSFYTPEEKYAHTFDAVRVPYPASAFALDAKPAWMKQRLTTWHGIYGPRRCAISRTWCMAIGAPC